MDLPISDEITVVLAEMWKTAISSYRIDCEKSLRGIRLKRDQLSRFLFRIRVDLSAMLQQPDAKRDFVTVFCQNFNQAITESTVDDETKAELHQRCDDLRDRLWKICEMKRDSAEKRRGDIASSGWLEERVSIVLNHLIRLMQSEIDRFHAGVSLLRDYYKAMDSPIPDSYVHPSMKLPLYQLPSEESLLAELANESSTPNPVESQVTAVSLTSQPPRPESRGRSKKSRSPKPSAEPDTTPSAVPTQFSQPSLEFIPRQPRELQPTVAQFPDSMTGEKKRKNSAGKKAADKKGKGW